MVARFATGFESGLVPSSLSVTNGTLTCTTANAASGAYSLVFTGTFSSCTCSGLGSFTASAATDDVWVGFNYRREFSNPGSSISLWMLTASGSIEVRLGSTIATQNGTLLTTIASGVIAQNTWHFVAVRIRPHDTTGQLEIAVDGVSIANLTGIDTLNSTASTARSFSFATATGSSLVTRLDDFMIGDSTGSSMTGLPVPHKIEALRPTSDIAAGFTRSTGADNYALVDEVPVSSSDFVSSNVPTTADIYGLADRTHTGTVLAVVANVVGRNSDGGGASVKVGVKRSGSQDQSSAKALAASETHVQHVSHVDPSTGVAYTTANVNALELTVEAA
jgi:hypothetical protein